MLGAVSLAPAPLLPTNHRPSVVQPDIIATPKPPPATTLSPGKVPLTRAPSAYFL